METTNKQTDLSEKILEGLRLSFKNLLEEKKRNNQKLVISRGNEIVWVTAEELETELKNNF